MLFNDLNGIAAYFDSMAWVGDVSWYDGPLETLYVHTDLVGNLNEDDYLIAAFYVEQESFHYFMVPYRVHDYCLYMMDKITRNEFVDTLHEAYTIRLEELAGIQHHVDIKLVERSEVIERIEPNDSMYNELMYYSQFRAHDEESILDYLEPIMRNIDRKLKIENLL